jgi:hypothetical protein
VTSSEHLHASEWACPCPCHTRRVLSAPVQLREVSCIGRIDQQGLPELLHLQICYGLQALAPALRRVHADDSVAATGIHSKQAGQHIIAQLFEADTQQ